MTVPTSQLTDPNTFAFTLFTLQYLFTSLFHNAGTEMTTGHIELQFIKETCHEKSSKNPVNLPAVVKDSRRKILLTN